MRLLKPILYVGIFLCLLFVSSKLLNKIFQFHSSYPIDPIVEHKLQVLSKNIDDFHVVFIGNSKVYNHVNPGVFDKVMEEHGYEIKSYNLAFPGMSFMEEKHMINFIGQLKPKKLKWIFIQPSDLRLKYKNILSNRSIYFSNYENIKFLINYSLNSGRFSKRIREILFGSLALLSKELNIGGFYQRFIAKKKPLKKSSKISSQGFYGRGSKLSLDYSKKPDFLGKTSSFLKKVDAYETDNLRKLNHGQVSAINAINDEIRAIGAIPVILLEATHGNKLSRAIYNSRSVFKSDAKVLGRRTPVLMPELFDVYLWRDIDHLNYHGAKIYTKSLAQEFAKSLSAE